VQGTWDGLGSHGHPSIAGLPFTQPRLPACADIVFQNGAVHGLDGLTDSRDLAGFGLALSRFLRIERGSLPVISGPAHRSIRPHNVPRARHHAPPQRPAQTRCPSKTRKQCRRAALSSTKISPRAKMAYAFPFPGYGLPPTTPQVSVQQRSSGNAVCVGTQKKVA